MQDNARQLLKDIPGVIEEPDYNSMDAESFVSQTEFIDKPEIAISVAQDGKEYSLCTLGNYQELGNLRTLALDNCLSLPLTVMSTKTTLQ